MHRCFADPPILPHITCAKILNRPRILSRRRQVITARAGLWLDPFWAWLGPFWACLDPFGLRGPGERGGHGGHSVPPLLSGNGRPRRSLRPKRIHSGVQDAPLGSRYWRRGSRIPLHPGLHSGGIPESFSNNEARPASECCNPTVCHVRADSARRLETVHLEVCLLRPSQGNPSCTP